MLATTVFGEALKQTKKCGKKLEAEAVLLIKYLTELSTLHGMHVMYLSDFR